MRLPAHPTVYYNPHVLNPNCPLCQTNVVGDEQHFLMICPAVKQERALLLSNVQPYNETEHFRRTLNNSSAGHLVQLAKLLFRVAHLLKQQKAREIGQGTPDQA